MSKRRRRFLWVLGLVLALLVGCQGTVETGPATETGPAAGVLALPTLAARDAGAEGPLRVVATTSIIGDVVGRVGGEAIALTTLMAAGQDPHSYEPSTTDLTRVAEADVVFVNGWNLEEGLARDLATIAGETPVVPISAGIEPLFVGESGAHGEDGATHDDDHRGDPDPHVWLDPQNVQQWAANVETVLSALDPANAPLYAANAADYKAQLVALEAEMEAALAQIPAGERKLVTNHDALAYFARRFDFEVVGTVLPSASTLSEPSAQALAALVETMRAEGVCTIFTETTANARLAETVAAELDSCPQVNVRTLHTGALGEADSYVEMMRGNVGVIGGERLETGDWEIGDWRLIKYYTSRFTCHLHTCPLPLPLAPRLTAPSALETLDL